MIDPTTHVEMCNAEFAAGRASRDAEVSELKKDAIDFHGQVNRLTEWNNNLVSHRDELIAERDEWKAGEASRDAEVAELRNELADALDCKSGSGPTALIVVIQERNQLREQLNTARDYLERLACLGNGNRHGNSVGNSLAIEALAATEPKP